MATAEETLQKMIDAGRKASDDEEAPVSTREVELEVPIQTDSPTMKSQKTENTHATTPRSEATKKLERKPNAAQ